MSHERLVTLLQDERTTLHEVKLSINEFGEFLFMTLSRPTHIGRRVSAITCDSLGFHQYRDRWIYREWFWQRAPLFPEVLERTVEKAAATQQIWERVAASRPQFSHVQSERGKWFEAVAESRGETAALAEWEKHPERFAREEAAVTSGLLPEDRPAPLTPDHPEREAAREPQPLLPDDVRAILPPLDSSERVVWDAPALVKFFIPDDDWSWYASAFDGKDTLFGLVVGWDVEAGYFSLSELEAVRGPRGLPVESDPDFEPTSLRKLHEQHFGEWDE
jgi:hypothetical protein